jgi:hypothetical protein
MKRLLPVAMLMLATTAVANQKYRVPESLESGEFGTYIPAKHFQILNIEFTNNTKLSDITFKLGESAVYSVEHTENYICYRNNSEVIEFVISSLGYRYRVMQAPEYSIKCPYLDEPFINDMKLRIGMSKESVTKLLGKPTSKSNEKLEYMYWVQEKPTAEVVENLKKRHGVEGELWLDVYSGVQLTFKKNQLKEYSIATTETF